MRYNLCRTTHVGVIVVIVRKTRNCRREKDSSARNIQQAGMSRDITVGQLNISAVFQERCLTFI